MFDFTLYHLRFTAEATTPIVLDEYKGSALRGAWHGYMQKAYCGAPPAARSDPLHQAMCPVCYLTNRETGPETRRPFALQPPLTRQRRFEPGERFQFGFTLFNHALGLFPYVLLALREVGEGWGLGQWLEAQRGRGRFRLARVEGWNPHTGEEEVLLAEGSQMVHAPTLAVTAETIERRAEALLGELSAPGAALRLAFLTPLRLIHHERLMHWFTFSFFYQRLLERLYALAEQFSPNAAAFGRPALIEDVERLAPLAEKVGVVANGTEWWDVKGYSKRQDGETFIGGLVGSVDLVCEDWAPLLPALLWGQSLQVGKNVVKGGGLYGVEVTTGGRAGDGVSEFKAMRG